MVFGVLLLAAGLAAPSVALDCTNGATIVAQTPASSSGRFEVRFPPPDKVAPFPYELVKGIIVTKVCIGGRQAWAMLDNRASTSLIDREFARALGLEISGPQRIGQTPAGEFPLYRASKFAVRVPGSFEFDAPMNAGDLGPMSRLLGRDVSLIVGQEFFENMALYVNPKAGTFLFRPSGSFTPGGKAQNRLVSIALDQNSQIPVTIDDVTFRLTIDLGYNGDLALKPEAWSKLARNDIKLSDHGTASLPGQIISARSGHLPEVRLGELKQSNVTVSIRPIPRAA